MEKSDDDREYRDFFDVFGPIDIVRTDRKILAPPTCWWREKVDGHYGWEGLSNAIGCYMFCIRDGETLRPWYVGMTVSQKGFEGEVFTEHKLGIYNDCIAKRRGRPVLFLFPLVLGAHDEGYRFSKAYKSKERTIAWLEKTLMGMAYASNPQIANVRDMTRLRTVTVRGLMGKRAPGRRHQDVEYARRALFPAR